MTQEEKARAYDKAIAKAKEQYNYPCMRSCMGILEEIFPELVESEDERVRKWLITQLELKSDVNNPHDLELMILKSIAWLERQGEHANFLSKIQVGDKVTRNEAGLLVNLSQLNRVAKKNEKQGEQKPIDTVEPKFHEGDFIKHNKANIICKVISVNSGSYYVENIETNGRIELFNARQNFHLWTIQDAKEGDVLAFKNNIGGIIICKSPTDYDTGSYCRLVNDNFINKEESGWDSTLLVPATKEQCDLLFQKMYEAGYTFDFERKELKKITQKSEKNKGIVGGISPNWSEEDEVKINRIVACLENLNVADNDILCKDVDWLKSHKLQPKQSLDEDTQQWIDTIIKDYEDLYNTDKDHRATIQAKISILKSLRPQNHWKPSKEQIGALKHAFTNGAIPFEEMEILATLYEGLKSII